MLNKNLKKHIFLSLSGFGAIALSIVFFFCIYRSSTFFVAVKDFMNILMPFIYGGVIAYLLTPLCTTLDKKLIPFFQSKFKNEKRAHSMAKGISITVAMLVALFVITGVFYLVIPQVVESIMNIIADLPKNSQKAYDWCVGFLNEHPEFMDTFSQFSEDYLDSFSVWMKNDLIGYFQRIVTEVSSGVIGVAGFFKNLLIGCVAAVYLLSGRRKFCAQAKKVIFALLNVDRGNTFINEIRFTSGIFGGFIRGKLLDSLIIGILCFIVMSIFNWPYAVLVSVIIGITNVIPFFGPFIGAVPATIIILTVSPIQSVYFVIFVFILQQFDGNILGPRILGETTGLSGFWVLFSILLFGGLFGFVGMVIGVPAFAVIYRLFSQFISWQLRKKNLPETTAVYDRTEDMEKGV